MAAPVTVYNNDITKLLGNCESTQEQATLSRLVADSDWSGVERLLEPLKTCEGYQDCLYLVYKQAYLDLVSASGKNNEKDLVLLLHKLRVLSPCKEDFMSLCSLLTTPSLTPCDEATPTPRQHLLHELSVFLHKNLHPNAAPPTDPTLLHNRLVDLVIRGVMYEQCEALCRERYNLPHPQPSQIIDVMTILQNMPDCVMTTPPLIQPILTNDPNITNDATSYISGVTPCISGITPFISGVTPYASARFKSRLSSTPKHPITRQQPSPMTTPISREATPISFQHTSHQGGPASTFPTCVKISCVQDTHPLRCVAFTDDGSKVAIGANSKTLRVLNAQPLATHDGTVMSTLPVVHNISDYHNSSIYCAAWANGSALLATGSNDQHIKLLHHGAVRHGGTVRDMCFIGDNHLVAGGSGTRPLKLIDVARLVVVDHYPTNAQVLALVAMDDNVIISGDDEGCVKIWDTRSHSVTSTITIPPSITSLTHYNGYLACSTTSATCHTLSLSTHTTLSQWKPHNDECRSIRYSPCGKYLLTSSYDKTICLTHTATMKYTTLCNHDDKVIQSRWHPSGCVFATTSADKTACFWRLNY